MLKVSTSPVAYNTLALLLRVFRLTTSALYHIPSSGQNSCGTVGAGGGIGQPGARTGNNWVLPPNTLRDTRETSGGKAETLRSPAPAAGSYLDLSVVQGAEIAFGRLNETRGGLLEAHGGHGRAILAGLLTGGLRVWIFGGFFRALAALAHRRSGGRSRRSGDERAKFSSRERDGIGSDT